MNFKVFKAARDSFNSRKGKYDFVSPSTHEDFVKMLNQAIRMDNVNTFVVNTFNTLSFQSIYYNFYESFHSMKDNTTLRESFFYVFSMICRHLSLLDTGNAFKLVNMICRQYYELGVYKFYDTCLLSHLMSDLPKEILENVVITNFGNIVKDLRFNDVHYLSTYASWRRSISQNFEELIKSFNNEFDNFVAFANMFPEYATRIYEYLIIAIAENKPECYHLLNYGLWNLIDDVLCPLADIEKYQYYYSLALRDNVEGLLKNAETVSIMYETADFLVEEFDISAHTVNSIIDANTDKVIDEILTAMDSSEGDSEQFDNAQYVTEILQNFFDSPRAYYRFMDNLPELLSKCGIVLYAILVKILGPAPELIKCEPMCYEMSSN